MYWIIEKRIHDEPFYENLLSFLERLDIPYELVDCVPFSKEIIPDPTPTGQKVMVLGSYDLVHATGKRDWTPGAFTNNNYDYRVWSKKWKDYCLNCDGKVYPFNDVPIQCNPFFIRPTEDVKHFTGKVMDWEEFLKFKTKVIDPNDTYYSMPLDTSVVITKPARIDEEYRFIIVDQKVITGSLYKQGTTGIYQECTDPELYEFAQKMADIWCPSRAFVLDIAKSSGELYVLEMGCVNAAGLYHCDVQKIVMALEDMVFDIQFQ
jgi:hypothetical protein